MKTPAFLRSLPPLLAAVCGAILGTHASAQGLDVLDPTGAIYTSVSDSSHYNNDFVAANLFQFDVTGIPAGTFISSDAVEFARQGGGSSYVAFQLDSVHANIGSLYYANRYAPVDAVNQISIWASSSAPFTAADPGTAPNTVVPLPSLHSSGAYWDEYPMTNLLSGQYFLLKFDQATVGGNPGGRELRFGILVNHPPTVAVEPGDKFLYPGKTARFTVQAQGTPPLAYQWYKGASPLANGGSISGATASTLVVSNVSAANNGGYSCVISNGLDHVATRAASLTVVDLPTNPAAVAVLSNSPVAFWQLNESAGPTAYDMVGGFDGAYGTGSGIGHPGRAPPDFTGFASDNAALQTYAFQTNSIVTAPALNLTGTNGTTITTWIYSDVSSGSQTPYTGIVFSRDYFTTAGLICSADGTKLAYQWNGQGFNFDSGLTIPANAWSFVALVYTPSAITLYCSSNTTVLSAVDHTARPVQTFGVGIDFGLDTDVGESARTFNGSLDDVAFYDHALTAAQINVIFAAGKGAFDVIPVQFTAQPAAPPHVYLGDSFTLTATVSGTAPQYQWYKSSAPIPNATNATFAVPSARLSDAADYYLVASNAAGPVSSSVVTVSVSPYLARPLNPTGILYTAISDSGHYNSDYVGANMFEHDMTGIPVGTFISFDATEYAVQGGGTSYVAFQLDQLYTNIGTIFYSQRYSGGDQESQVSLWGRASGAFAASDPGTSPDTVIPLTPLHGSGAYWDEYYMTNVISGRYFLLRFDQNTPGGNPGGREFRLGLLFPPTAIAYSATPSGLVLTWDNATLEQADNVSGPWTTATGVTSGNPIPTTAATRFYRLRY